METSDIYILKDVARISGLSIHTVKFYLKIGLIHEHGRSPSTRFRYFNNSTIERLTKIRALRKKGRSLSDIQRVLGASNGTSSVNAETQKRTNAET